MSQSLLGFRFDSILSVTAQSHVCLIDVFILDWCSGIIDHWIDGLFHPYRLQCMSTHMPEQNQIHLKVFPLIQKRDTVGGLTQHIQWHYSHSFIYVLLLCLWQWNKLWTQEFSGHLLTVNPALTLLSALVLLQSLAPGNTWRGLSDGPWNQNNEL